MARIENLSALQATLRERAKEAKEANVSVLVGFGTNYALYVHENLEANHPVGQAKFLEQPAREMQRDLADIVVEGMRKGIGMVKSLLLAGLRLQREAQIRCPVDTGAMRASAFTRLEE